MLYQSSTNAPGQPNAWLACGSPLQDGALVKLGRRIRKCRDGIPAAVRVGLGNTRLEGLSATVRVIRHRGYGCHGLEPNPSIRLIYRCAGDVHINLASTPNR